MQNEEAVLILTDLVSEVELKKIRPNRLNPRLSINVERLNDLADSIKQIGVLEPLIVRPTDDGYEVVVGERRYRASQQARLQKIPVIIRDYSDEQVIELNLVENIQREDLSAVEKGNCCRQLMEKFPDKYPTQGTIARKIGVSNESISAWVRLTKAPKELQKIIAPAEKAGVPREEGKLDYSTAVAITRQIEEPERQVEVAKEIAKSPLHREKAKQVVTIAAKERERPVEEVIKEVAEAPYELSFRLDSVQPILKGIKTQITKKVVPDPKVKTGAVVHAAVWEPRFADLRIISVERKRLKYFTEEDAKAEGGYTLEEFKKMWKKQHEEWNENELVYIIHFEKMK
jgi:ParB family chromosome partitioning protein